MSEQRARPIIFSTAMVRAILDGRKVMTRRVWRTLKACPVGEVGDLLWVRETWCPLQDIQECARAGEPITIAYKADWDTEEPDREVQRDMGIDRWRSGRFMPRWASRLTLRVIAVRNERLGDITHEDALAEGFEDIPQFLATWDKLNAPRGYACATNPWVWVITFVIETQTDKDSAK